MLTPSDVATLKAIDAAVIAGDDLTVARLIRDYYRDLDRAERTPRDRIYLHLGFLTGIVQRLVAPDA
jgi:hypothetical protein